MVARRATIAPTPDTPSRVKRPVVVERLQLRGADRRLVPIEALHRAVDAGGQGRLALIQIEVDARGMLSAAYGRHAVAALTQVAAAQLARELRHADRVAVAAPGSIVVMLADVDQRSLVEAVVARLLPSLQGRFEREGRFVRVPCIIAATLATDAAARRLGIWLALESAANAAATLPLGACGWPSVAETADLDGSRRTRLELLEAADAARFFPVYQPQLDFVTGCFDRVEVLMRWRRKDGSVAGPGAFLDDLRALGRLPAVSEHVYTAALQEARSWLETGLDLRRIALNLDLCQVEAEGWADPLLRMIAAAGLSPDRVELEVSERILEAADIDRLARGLARLRDRGVLVSLDDFGAGYGSLTQLARLPVDLVKLDARLLWDADTTPRTRTLVQGVVALTTTLELPCLFEGIETPRQLALAHGVGARFGQGFHLSRPIEAGAVPPVLRSHRPIAMASAAAPG